MNRLEKLKELEAELKNLMSKANSRSFAPLAKQYRDTIREIEEIEGGGEDGGEIEKILSDTDGKPNAIR